MPDVIKTITIQAVDLSTFELTGKSLKVKGLVDTGATKTVISSAVAKKLGLRLNPSPVALRGLAGSQDAQGDCVVLGVVRRACQPFPSFVAVVPNLRKQTGHDVIVGIDYQDEAKMIVIPFAREITCKPEPVKALLESLRKFEDYFDEPKPKTKRKPSKRRAQRPGSKR